MITSPPPDDSRDLTDDQCLSEGIPDDLLLIRYWEQRVSVEERERVERYFSHVPEQRERLARVYRGLKSGAWAPWAPEKIATRTVSIVQAVAKPQKSSETVSLPKWRGRGWHALLAGMAGAVLIIATQYLSTYWPKTSTWAGRSVYTTGNGERATIALPDGSVIVLSVGSQLEVPSDYSSRNRTLRLAGEALFSVTHSHETPFIVVAGPSVTRVLGTRFVVRHYATDSVATVAVADGKVAVGDAVLSAKQLVRVTERGIRAVEVAPSTQFEFAEGRLKLEGRLEQLIPDLTRWYNAEIQLGDLSLADREIVLECGDGSVADLEAILGVALNIRVVRNGRTLTLYPLQ